MVKQRVEEEFTAVLGEKHDIPVSRKPLIYLIHLRMQWGLDRSSVPGLITIH